MKEREFQNCCQCGKSMFEGIFFYRVKVEQHIVNADAVRRRVGLGMQIGALAAAMGPDEDLAIGTGEKTVLFCGDCGTGIGQPALPIACLLETSEKEENNER